VYAVGRVRAGRRRLLGVLREEPTTGRRRRSVATVQVLARVRRRLRPDCPRHSPRRRHLRSVVRRMYRSAQGERLLPQMCA